MSPPPFLHCYHCGHAPLEVVSARQCRCPQCGRSQFVTPTPAAVAVVLDAQDRLLLMRRAHEPALGKLGLPGGVIEPMEPAEAACARELREETGLDLPATAFRYLGTWCNEYLFQGYVWPTLDIVFVARTADFTAAHAADGEASEIVALPLKQIDLETLAFPTHAAAIRQVMAT